MDRPHDKLLLIFRTFTKALCIIADHQRQNISNDNCLHFNCAFCLIDDDDEETTDSRVSVTDI